VHEKKHENEPHWFSHVKQTGFSFHLPQQLMNVYVYVKKKA